MKKFYPPPSCAIFILSVLLFVLSHNNCSAQTLVNKTMEMFMGHPTTFLDHMCLAKDENDFVYLAGNTFVPGLGRVLIVGKIGSDGPEWLNVFDTINNGGWSVHPTDITTHGNHAYVTGTAIDSTGLNSVYFTANVDSAGNTVGVNYLVRSGLNVATAVRMVKDPYYPYDDYLITIGSMQTDTADAAIGMVIYHNGTQTNLHIYDSIGLYDIPALVTIDSVNVYITGVSGSTFGNWDFLTLTYRILNSDLTVSRSSNGNGGYARVTGLAKDGQKNIYITGYYTDSTGHTNIKTIKYDSLLNELWVNIYDGPDGLDDQATWLKNSWDNGGSFFVSGYTTPSNGAKDLLLLKYDRDGTLEWSRTISSEDNTKDAVANKVAVDGSENSFITGKAWHNGGYCFVTAAYDADGNMRWLKYNQPDSSVYSEAKEILFIDPNRILTAGICIKPGDTSYVMVEYEQWDMKTSKVNDTSGVPAYLRYQLVIKFDTSAVIKDNIDSLNIQFAAPDFFLKQSVIDSIENKLPDIFTDYSSDVPIPSKISRLYKRMTSDLTHSISRGGDTIPVPDLWATLILNFNTHEYSVSEIIDSLNTLFPIIKWAEPNFLLQVSTPNDPDFTSHQTSLLDPLQGGGDINVTPVWDDYQVFGSPFVKVGILDGGIMARIEDFGGDGTNSNSNKVEGYDFTGGGNYFTSAQITHGNAMSSIIGAIRNNNIKMAGIAGGNSANVSDLGVKLYGMNIYEHSAVDYATADKISDAIIESSLYNPSLSYGWGLHVLNLSSNYYAGAIAGVSGQLRYISEALHEANRNQVTIVNSSGNLNQSGVQPPGNCEDDWALVVSGSDEDALYHTGSYGPEVDLSAPGHSVWAIETDIQSGPIDGTSASAAHVSGAAALLLSYLNSSTPSLDNLAPEDVEFILQQSAVDLDLPPAAPGLDDHTGFGKLDCGAAFNLISKPIHRILHLSKQRNSFNDIQHQRIISVAPYTVQFDRPYRNLAGTFDYKAWVDYDAYEIEIDCDIDYANYINQGDVVQFGWTRSSSSNLFGELSLTNGVIPTIKPYEKLVVTNDATQCCISMKSYAYAIYEHNNSSNFLGYVPFNPWATNVISPNVEEAFSLLIENTENTATTDLKIDGNIISLLPNPSSANNMISVSLKYECELSIQLFDVSGRLMKEIDNGKFSKGSHQFKVNVENLAKGLYCYKINIDNARSYPLKFIKQ